MTAMTTPGSTSAATGAATAAASGLPRHLDAGLPAPPRADAWWRRAAAVAFGAWLRVDAEGAHHVPATGGVLIAASHASHADSPTLGLAIDRPLSFLGDEKLQSWPIIGRHFPTMGLVPVDRGRADLDALGHLAALLELGHAVVVFPEGSRTRDGAVHRPRSGVARLAAATGVPVVPVGLDGTAAAWPVDGRPRLGRPGVRVRIGAPMIAPADNPADRRRFAAELHDHLVALSGRPRADTFASIGAPR